MRRAAALAILLLAASAQDADDIRQHLADLGSPDEQTRANGAARLGRMGPRAKSAAPALAKALGDESGWVARLAFEALLKIGPDVVPALVKALGSSDEYVRAAAIRLLDESFVRNLIPHLRAIAPLLRDENLETRQHAASALGQQGGQAIDLLIAAFAARETDAHDAAILGLTKVGGIAVEPLTRALATGSGQVRVGAARALGALKASGAAGNLLAALSDKAPEVAAAAARALSQIGALPDMVVPRLLDGLRDANGTFRDGCVDALAGWGEYAVPGLIAALGAEDTREGASLAFLRMQERGPAALKEAIGQGAPPGRCAALATLGRFNPALVADDTIKAVRLCLGDGSPAVRAEAARALACLGPRAKDDGLKKGMADDDPAVRAASFRALGELGMDPGKADDPDPAVKVEAVLATWKIWGGAGGEDLRRIAFDATADVRVRAAALAALGEMGLGAEGVDLTPLVEKQPVEVRRAAVDALARTTLPSALAIRDSRAAAKPDKTVAAGLAWLAKAQAEDGQWDAGSEKNLYYTSGVTGLALLAFLGAGCGPDEGQHGTTVRTGLAYLIRGQNNLGILSNKATHEYLLCHGIATMALVEAYTLTGDYRYRRAAQWALDPIAWARNPGLAWRYDPRGGENDTHITTWLLFATRLGDVAGLRVDGDTYAGAAAWIDRMTDRGGRTGYTYPGGASARPEGYQDTFPADRVEPMTAAGLWCRHLLGGKSLQVPVYGKGIDLVLAKEPRWSPGYQDMIYWHFATLALFQDGDASSRKWGKPLLAALSHGRDAATGAWRPEDVWSSDMTGAKTYATAMGVLTLLTPTRYPRDFLTKPKLSAASRAAIAALRKACADEDAQVREIAAAACARLGG